MCGICGAMTFSGRDFLEPIPALVDMMTRRGPDDEGVWSDDETCALGFRRLAIQDLSAAGHQPMVSADGRYVLVFNGEVYNFRELRTQLSGIGFKPRSSGDAEVVLNALIHWGESALDRFNGMFAIGFYDTVAKSLLLARDHAGIKPLYILQTNRGVVFASQYDQILRHPESAGLDVSPDALGLYLRLGYIPAPHAILQRTQLVKPGTWIRINKDGDISQGAFFQFAKFSQPDIRGSEAIEAVDAAVSNAVRRQLISDVPVGAFLSGGIDSPLINAKIKEANHGSFKAFTIGTAGDKSDESADAATYAAALGLDHLIEHVTSDQVIGLLDNVVEACGEPFGDFSIFPTMLVSGVAHREVTVMLSGDGGDELFWGYAKRFGTVIGAAETFGQPYWLRSARWAAKRYLGVGTAFPQMRWPTIGPWYRTKQTHIQDAWLSRIFREPPPWPKDDFDLFDYTGHDQDQTAQWVRWNEFTGRMNMILMKVDRASMYHSLEVRVPLLDREVVDVAARIDWQTCLDLKQGLGKLPLRAALARHVNNQTQAKRGFTVPMHQWLEGPLRPLFEAEVLERDNFLGVETDKSEIRKFYGALLNGQGNLAWGLWLLLSLALWENRYLKSRPLR